MTKEKPERDQEQNSHQISKLDPTMTMLRESKVMKVDLHHRQRPLVRATVTPISMVKPHYPAPLRPQQRPALRGSYLPKVTQRRAVKDVCWIPPIPLLSFMSKPIPVIKSCLQSIKEVDRFADDISLQ